MRHLSGFLLVLGLLLSLPGLAQAQSRFGGGLQFLGSTADDNIGPGVRFRVSTPINRDVSVAVGSGFTGFIFQGRDDAAYALDPQVSTIVSFSRSNAETIYVLGGAGVFVPFGDTTTDSGPTFHVGIGRAWLLEESSLFFEVNPGFLVGSETTTLVLPLRVGVIF